MTLPRFWISGPIVSLLILGCGARTAVQVGQSQVDGGSVDAGAPELCNGRDDDGDMRIDETLHPGSFLPRIPIRSEEGSTGDCRRCRWATNAALLPTRNGMLAVMTIYDPFSGNPNVFGRALDTTGRPTEEWRTLFDAPIYDALPTFRRDPDGEYSVGTNQKIGVVDHTSFARLDADGNVSHGLESFGTILDGRSAPEVVAMPDGTLIAAHKCSGDDDLCLVRLTPEVVRLEGLGRSGASRELVREGGAGVSSPSIDVRGDRIGAAILQAYRDAPMRLVFLVLDAEGRVLNEVAVRLPRDAFRIRPFETLEVHSTETGWFVMFQRFEAAEEGEPQGRWVARFDGEGELVDGPTNHEPDYNYFDASTHLQPHPAGGFLLSGQRSRVPFEPGDEQHYVAYLDPTGRMLWYEVVLRLAQAVVLDDGRVFAVLSGERTPDEANALHVIELVCPPI